jgi:rhodanese-related sulfurtransferase
VIARGAPLLAALGLAALGACDAGHGEAHAAPQAASTRPASIDGPAARALVASGATLLDVRSAGEWAGGHLEGARHVPVGELAGRITELPRDRPVVVYCASGFRSARAATMLAEAGFTVHDLGAMDRWGG